MSNEDQPKPERGLTPVHLSERQLSKTPVSNTPAPTSRPTSASPHQHTGQDVTRRRSEDTNLGVRESSSRLRFDDRLAGYGANDLGRRPTPPGRQPPATRHTRPTPPPQPTRVRYQEEKEPSELAVGVLTLGCLGLIFLAVVFFSWISGVYDDPAGSAHSDTPGVILATPLGGWRN